MLWALIRLSFLLGTVFSKNRTREFSKVCPEGVNVILVKGVTKKVNFIGLTQFFHERY